MRTPLDKRRAIRYYTRITAHKSPTEGESMTTKKDTKKTAAPKAAKANARKAKATEQDARRVPDDATLTAQES